MNLRSSLKAFAAATVLAGASLTTLPALSAGAAGSTSFSFTSSATSLANGRTLDLRSIQPVVNAGTQTGTITDEVDPSKVRIVDPSNDIVAPAGWTLTFSTDGTNWFPYDPSEWDPSVIRYVKATGTVDSTGSVNGRVVAQNVHQVEAPTLASLFGGGGGGDGWDVAVDTVSGNVYNLYHHDGAWQSGFSTGAIDCHSAAGGGECAGNWPFKVTNLSDPYAMHSGDQAWETVDSLKHHIWFPTSTNFGVGFGCVDVSNPITPHWCGGTERTGFVQTSSGGGNGRNSTTSFARVGSKIFTIGNTAQSLQCVDMSANRGLGAPCTNQPLDLSDLGAPGAATTSLVAFGGKVMGVQNSHWICVDPATVARCSGWSSWKDTSFLGLHGGWNNVIAFVEPGADGSAAAVCAYSANGNPWVTPDVNPLDCRDTSGAAVTGDSALETAMISSLSTNPFGTAKPWPRVGSKLYFNRVFAGGSVFCFDVATSDWCDGWGSSPRGDWSMYTVTLDPMNPNCLWTNGDQSGIGILNANDGSTGCPAMGPAEVTFDDNVLIPRLSCSGASIAQWQQFALLEPSLGPGKDATSATLTINDSNGAPIPGWTNVAIPNSGIVNMAQLQLSTSGTTPTFTVDFQGRNASALNTAARLRAVSDQPQLCVHATVNQCPAHPGIGQIPTIGNATTQLVSKGKLTGVVDTSTDLTLGLLARSPGATGCGNSIGGTARYRSNAPVAGAKVKLYQSVGGVVSPVLDQSGKALVATTGSDGSYSFPSLGPGSYQVQFTSVSPSVTVASTTLTGGSGTQTATQSPATSEAVAISDANRTVDAVFAGAGSLPPLAPTNLAVVSGNGQVTVSWDPPTWDGGSPVTSYLVVSPDGQTCTVSAASPRTCTFTGLTNLVLGTFTFYAANVNGPSYPATKSGQAGGWAGSSLRQLEVLNGEFYASNDLVSWTDLGPVPANTNALAYQPADGFAYALDNDNSVRHLLRIAADGTVQTLGVVDNQGTMLTAGAIDPATGIYYVTSTASTLYKVVPSGRGHYRLVAVPTMPGLWIGADFTIHNGVLTSVGNGKVYTWTIGQTSGVNVGTRVVLGANSTIGAMWTDPVDGVDFRFNAAKAIYHLGGIGSTPTVTIVNGANGVAPEPVDGASVVGMDGSATSSFFG